MENQGDCAHDEETKMRRPEALAVAAAGGSAAATAVVLEEECIRWP